LPAVARLASFHPQRHILGNCLPVEKMLNEGDTAPAFTAATDSGSTLSLESLRGRPVVLYFYPKDATEG
jgi:peroxiredoxin